MVFIVVRHGESEWNKLNKFTGWENINISEKGILESEIAGKLLSKYNFDSIYTSDLIRTITTSEIIINSNSNNKNFFTQFSSELKERDYGDLTGKNKSELEEIYGKEQIFKWRRGYYDKPPNGENLDDVVNRVGVFFDNEIKPLLLEGSNVLIVSHGNTLRALFVHLQLKNKCNIEEFEISTGIPIKINLDTNDFEYINRYELKGTQIIDSRGFPTIQVECWDKITNKMIGKGSTPSGASCGSTEVLELRDNDPTKFMGKSVFNAIDKLIFLNKKLCLNNLTNLEYIDNQLLQIDMSEKKEFLGGNTTTAISFCFGNVGSNLLNIELFEYFSKIYNNSKINYEYLPTPMVNIINGGKHGITDDLKIQEFMILCDKTYSIDKQIQIICEVYHSLKQILVNKFGLTAKSIGDEGGFCPPIYSAEEAINIISDAIRYANYIPGIDVFIALDCASSEFFIEETKLYEIEKNKFLTSIELVEYYENLITKFPYLISIEDGFHESDYNGWNLFMKKLGSKIMIVGDDLFTTNPKLINFGIKNNLANTLLLKVNQIGTITEAIQSAKIMFKNNFNVIVSHRSGETNHSYIVDLAVGIGAQYLKIGSPCRGERVAKFNRLIEINNYYKNIYN